MAVAASRISRTRLCLCCARTLIQLPAILAPVLFGGLLVPVRIHGRSSPCASFAERPQTSFFRPLCCSQPLFITQILPPLQGLPQKTTLPLLLSASEGTMRASDTAGGRRAAVARGVIYRVIYSTTRTLFTSRPISDLGESRGSE